VTILFLRSFFIRSYIASAVERVRLAAALVSSGRKLVRNGTDRQHLVYRLYYRATCGFDEDVVERLVTSAR